MVGYDHDGVTPNDVVGRLTMTWMRHVYATPATVNVLYHIIVEGGHNDVTRSPWPATITSACKASR